MFFFIRLRCDAPRACDGGVLADRRLGDIRRLEGTLPESAEGELTKLKALPAEQLATRVASLTAKDEAGGPGKRLVRRQLRRVEALHAKATAKKGTK